MTNEQEVKILQEMQRHQQALEDISSGKTAEKEVSKEDDVDEFISLMNSMNKSSTDEPEQEQEPEEAFIKDMKDINKS